MKHRNVWILLILLLVAAPLAAQNATPVRPMATPNLNVIQVDYKQQWEKEREKNQQLRAENASLQSQLAEWTRKGGSQVHAYCEAPTLSVNSAGSRNDCAASGYTCEPVSGLCRTSAANGSECAIGRQWCVYGNRCVASPAECKQ